MEKERTIDQAVELKSPYNGVSIFRSEKIIFARFNNPHTVISTCRVNGGIKEDLEVAANHQSCEPKPCFKTEHKRCLAVREPQKYHSLVCNYHGLDPKTTCLMGTAANMNCAGMSKKSFKDLIVFSIVTAGVETNAGRAGDAASVYETEEGFEHLKAKKAESNPNSGTINTLILINKPLTPAALVRSVKMATEAKTSVLQELNVGSRYSDGLATGTGTDQICICSQKTSQKPLTGAGKHVKLGELIALSVRDALREALDLQNRLTPTNVRYLPRLTARFGLDEDTIIEKLRALLPEDIFFCLKRNKWTFFEDPILLAHILSFLHIRDQIKWDIVPKNNSKEALLQQGALIASAVSGKAHRFSSYLSYLERDWEPKSGENNLLILALSIGFKEKWEVPWHN